jgi:uronate dehydrogenase
MSRVRAVLVTGSAGRIGRAVCAELIARGHRVRGFDRVPSPALTDAVVGDVVSPADVARALDGMDTAVHLAATPDEADFLTRLLPNNVVGLYHVLEAARHARLARLILVSSGQLYRGHDGPLPITPATPTSPRNWYALTKVLTEAAGHVYARAHGLNVVVIRPGWVPRDPRTPPSWRRALTGRTAI